MSADFRRLWAAATISAAGSQISAFAIPIAAIVLLRASPLEVGFLMALTYLPLTLFGLFAGAWSDRVRRRPLLVFADLLRAGVLATLPAAYAFHVLTLPLVSVVAFTAGILTVFFDVAHGAYLPDLVDTQHLVAANARLQISDQGASVLGPAAGALLVTAVGAPYAIAIDALSFIGSAAFLLGIRYREELPGEAPANARAILLEVGEGIRYVAGRPSLRAFATSSFITNLFLRMISTVLVLHLVRTAGMAPTWVGFVLAGGELGFLLGALSASPIRRRFSVPTTVTAAITVISISGYLVALAPLEVAGPLAALGLFMYGFCATSWAVTTAGYRQATTPAGMLGRAGAVGRVASWGPIPLAALAAGAIASGAGTRATLLVAAVGATSSVVPIYWWRRKGALD